MHPLVVNSNKKMNKNRNYQTIGSIFASSIKIDLNSILHKIFLSPFGVINATCHKSLSKFRNSTKPNTSALRGKNKRIQISISFAFKTGFLTGNVIEFDSEELHFQTLYNIF